MAGGSQAPRVALLTNIRLGLDSLQQANHAVLAALFSLPFVESERNGQGSHGGLQRVLNRHSGDNSRARGSEQ